MKYTKYRCRIKGCPRSSSWYCTRCKVYLCNSAENQCFISWHVDEKPICNPAWSTGNTPKSIRKRKRGAAALDEVPNPGPRTKKMRPNQTHQERRREYYSESSSDSDSYDPQPTTASTVPVAGPSSTAAVAGPNVYVYVVPQSASQIIPVTSSQMHTQSLPQPAIVPAQPPLPNNLPVHPTPQQQTNLPATPSNSSSNDLPQFNHF